ncbi:MAG: SOS response-associated peptidase [Planctomycetota bacterium]
MCGRYSLIIQAEEWTTVFQPLLPSISLPETLPANTLEPRYNIAPTQTVPVLKSQEGTVHIDGLRWGLIPFWADDLSIGNRMINARSETAHEKASFKHAFKKRRCLIPTTGYYEWRKEENIKQPYWIHSANDQKPILTMAGLWEVNRKVGDQPVLTCTILTTDANQTTADVHHRMPVFLDESDHQDWIDSENQSVDSLRDLLRPAEDSLLKLRAVSRYVSNARHEGPKCLASQ